MARQNLSDKRAPVVALLVLISAPALLWGAKNGTSICDRDPSTGLVFVGVLTTSKPARPSASLLTFQISEVLEGEASDEITVTRYDRPCGGAENVLSVGTAYLVRTHLLKNGVAMGLDQCEDALPLAQAASEVEYFRSAQKGETPTEVSGDTRVGYVTSMERIPMPGTKVHLAGNGNQYDLASDEDGYFRSDLKPGQYSVAVNFPTGFELEPALPVVKFAAVEHYCTSVTLNSRPTSSFNARIADEDGTTFNILSNIQLTVETAEDQKFIQSVWPNEKSYLVVENIMPGRYVLGLNTWLGVDSGMQPYPPIYYPGVSRRADAQIITLEPGEHKVLPEMRIKKGTPCEIPVRVLDASGSPSGGAQVALAYPDAPHFYLSREGDSDPMGLARIHAVFPGPVLLRAERSNGQGDAIILSDVVEVPSCPSQPVLLKLSKTVPKQ